MVRSYIQIQLLSSMAIYTILLFDTQTFEKPETVMFSFASFIFKFLYVAVSSTQLCALVSTGIKIILTMFCLAAMACIKLNLSQLFPVV